jgi:quinoprotein relay system zinc metallohydrolase 2
MAALSEPGLPAEGRWRPGLSRRRALIGGACLCCLPAGARAAAARIEQVAPGVYMRRGVDEDATAANLDAIANVGFIVGRDGVLVTESGGSLAEGQWLRRAIRATTDKPIRHVVLSHVHPDHVFGAGAFAPDDPVFIGHARLKEALELRGAYYRQRLAAVIGAERAGPVVQPTRLVADGGEIDLGDRVVALRAHGPAHTVCDLSMLDGASGLLLPADLLFVKRIPSLDGSLLGWLKELAALRGLGAAKAVPGHGPLLVDFAAAAAELARYLTVLRDGVRAEIAGNGSIEAAVKTVGQGERGRWLLFEDYHARNVIAAYKELEWE